MVEKICPVTQRVSMDGMAPQAAGTSQRGREIVRKAAIQVHSDEPSAKLYDAHVRRGRAAESGTTGRARTANAEVAAQM